MSRLPKFKMENTPETMAGLKGLVDHFLAEDEKKKAEEEEEEKEKEKGKEEPAAAAASAPPPRAPPPPVTLEINADFEGDNMEEPTPELLNAALRTAHGIAGDPTKQPQRALVLTTAQIQANLSPKELRCAIEAQIVPENLKPAAAGFFEEETNLTMDLMKSLVKDFKPELIRTSLMRPDDEKLDNTRETQMRMDQLAAAKRLFGARPSTVDFAKKYEQTVDEWTDTVLGLYAHNLQNPKMLNDELALRFKILARIHEAEDGYRKLVAARSK